MTEKEVLGFKPTTRLEQAGDKHPECIKDRKDRNRRCNNSTLSCRFRLDGVFGKDRRDPNAPIRIANDVRCPRCVGEPCHDAQQRSRRMAIGKVKWRGLPEPDVSLARRTASSTRFLAFI